MAPLQCRKCGLLNPPGSVKCDCGFRLGGELTYTDKGLLARHQDEKRRLKTAGFLCVVVGVAGLLLTGGRAALFGLFPVIVGARLLRRASRLH